MQRTTALMAQKPPISVDRRPNSVDTVTEQVVGQRRDNLILLRPEHAQGQPKMEQSQSMPNLNKGP